MSRIDRIALAVSLITILFTFFISERVYDRMPHLEDEMAYVWQARAASRGALTTLTPPCPRCFLVPFVVDYQGLRFGKYPPGWPALLAIGEMTGVRDWVNPLLSGFSIWLLYLLIKKILDEKTALLGAFLGIGSPFFLMNAASLLSHVWSLFLTLAFCHAWIDLFWKRFKRPKLLVWVAGLTLGLLALTRPLTALSIAIPFALHGLYLLWKGDQATRLYLIAIGAITGSIAILIFAWQYAVTGDPLLNPYTLWWPYDQVGFGPDVGLQKGGYEPRHIWLNTRKSLRVGNSDLFGWPYSSWLFLPFGLLAIRKNLPALLVASIFPSLIIGYSFYWVGSWLYGPRYYFEALPGLILLTAAGIRWLAGGLRVNTLPLRWSIPQRIRIYTVSLLVGILAAGNIFFFLPQRLAFMTDLYGANRERLLPFLSPQAQELAPALVLVTPVRSWVDYGTLLELTSPFMDTPFIFTISRKPEQNLEVIYHFPGRSVWYYYTDEPDRLYTAPRPIVTP